MAGLSAKLKGLLSKGSHNPLLLIYDDQSFATEDGETRVFVDEDAAAALEQILDQFPERDGLEIHYQGKELLCLFTGRVSKSISQHLASRLPPGTALADYQLAFVEGLVALLPRKALDPIYQVAKERALATCHIKAIPVLEDGNYRVGLGDQDWMICYRDGLPHRLLPLPNDQSLLADPEYLLEEVDFGGQILEKPLFEWVDPGEKARQTARANRRVLLLVALGCVLVLGLLGGGLWGASRHYENRLLDLSQNHQEIKARAQEQRELLARLEATLAEVETIQARKGLITQRAVLTRKIMNLCPQGLRLARLGFQKDLDERINFDLDGYAKDAAQATELVRVLQKEMGGFNAVMAELTKIDPNERKYRQLQLGVLTYRFKILLEPRP